MITPEQALREFEAVFDRRTQGLPAKVVLDTQRGMALEALDGVVFGTPVDTGRTRGNWQATIGAPAENEVDRLDPSGRDTKAAGEAVINAMPPFEVFWLANNAENVLVLELGLFDPPDPGPSKDKRKGRLGRVLVKGGYSVQAPQGMVALTVQRLTTKYG